MKNDYVSIVYDEKRVPKTKYPTQLAGYLFGRFRMKKGEKLLEIGCGRGEFLEAFHALGMEVNGIDISSFYQKQDGCLKVDCADISRDLLPFADKVFDVVYHKSLLEHLYDPKNLMKETFRVLKPGGKVIILTPDWASQMKVFYEDFTHCKPYNRDAIRDLLLAYGFTNIHAELFYQLPVIWEYPGVKIVSKLLGTLFPTPIARKITEITKIKFFRWSAELMILGSGMKF